MTLPTSSALSTSLYNTKTPLTIRANGKNDRVLAAPPTISTPLLSTPPLMFNPLLTIPDLALTAPLIILEPLSITLLATEPPVCSTCVTTPEIFLPKLAIESAILPPIENTVSIKPMVNFQILQKSSPILNTINLPISNTSTLQTINTSTLQINNSLFARSFISKAAVSGVALGAVGQFYDKTGFSIKQAGLQARCSYVSPAVADTVTLMLNIQQQSDFIDGTSTATLYALSSGPLGIDNRSMMFKFLVSFGSDVAAGYAKPYLPVM